MISSLGNSTSYASLLTSRVGTATASQTTGQTMQASAPPPPPPPPPPPSSASVSGGAEPQSLFEALAANDDADGDGLLSAEEIANSPVADLLSSQFSDIDSDGDGLLSEDEITIAEQSSRSGASGMGAMGEMPPPPPPEEAADEVAATDEAGSDPASIYESLFNLLSEWQEGSSTEGELDELAQRFMDALKQAA